MGHPGAEALPRHAGKGEPDRVFRQPFMTVTFGHFARQHGARRTIGVADWETLLHRLAVLKGWLGGLDEFAIQDVMDRMILTVCVVSCNVVANVWLVEQFAEVQSLGFPVLRGCLGVEHI